MASSRNNKSRLTSPSTSAQDTPSSSSLSVGMTRSPSSGQAKVTKRKGSRSVSNLNPLQLDRKRNNDRLAQRAIRARTKEHIARLEAELDELRAARDHDPAIQDLLRKNHALEDEVNRLRECVHSSWKNQPIFDDNMNIGSGAPNPRTSSPYPSGGGYVGHLQDYGHGYLHFAPSCEAWTATVSSPASSVGTDEFTTPGQYLSSTSAPMNVRPGSGEVKVEYFDSNDHGFPTPMLRSPSSSSRSSSYHGTPLMNSSMLPSSAMRQQSTMSPWTSYPVLYQAQSPA